MIGQLTMTVKNFKSFNPNSGGVTASATGGKRVNTETCARIAKLRSEIDDLQQAVAKEREKYQAQASVVEYLSSLIC